MNINPLEVRDLAKDEQLVPDFGNAMHDLEEVAFDAVIAFVEREEALTAMMDYVQKHDLQNSLREFLCDNFNDGDAQQVLDFLQEVLK